MKPYKIDKRPSQFMTILKPADVLFGHYQFGLDELALIFLTTNTIERFLTSSRRHEKNHQDHSLHSYHSFAFGSDCRLVD